LRAARSDSCAPPAPGPSGAPRAARATRGRTAARSTPRIHRSRASAAPASPHPEQELSHLEATAHTELVEDRGHLVGDGALGAPALEGDVAVAQAVADEPSDVRLRDGQARLDLRARRDAAAQADEAHAAVQIGRAHV